MTHPNLAGFSGIPIVASLVYLLIMVHNLRGESKPRDIRLDGVGEIPSAHRP